MARMNSSRSAIVEETEGDLALLGNSLIYLGLVDDRIQAAMAVLPQQAILAPAVEDLQHASHLIRSVQQRVSDRLTSQPAFLFPESRSEKNHKVHQTGQYSDGRRKKGRRS